MVSPFDFLGGGTRQMNEQFEDPARSGASRLGKFGGGLFETLTGGKLPQVDRQYASLDPGSNSLIDQAQREALQSPEEVSRQLLGNAEGARGLLASEGDFANQDTRLGGASPEGMNRALSQRASQGFDRDMGKLKSAANFGAYGELSDRMGTAFTRAQQQEAIKQGAELRRAQYDRERKNQRQGIINNVLGTAGSMGGYFAGGAAGASAGKEMATKAYGGGI